MASLSPSRSQLLISVRSAPEAEIALRGGAALIDVKEPTRGAMGPADPEVIRAVLEQVAGRCPVSAALGELTAQAPRLPVSGLGFVKWGLAGWGHDSRWKALLAQALEQVRQVDGDCRGVPVAYADWHRANAPSPWTVAQFAQEHRCAAWLLDTWEKDGTTLLDWLSVSELAGLCSALDIPIALAGSLAAPQIRALRAVQPRWFAVRGAACRAGERQAELDEQRIRQLADILTE
ncbi:MAG: (5-formylfuran-3-yl)methyl phosphate synthase [Gemmataceae bacterium]